MRLTAEVAKLFGAMKAEIKGMTEECEELSKNIKDEMVARNIDEFAPKGSPYKLVKTEYDSTAVDYKELAMNAYRLLHGKTWGVKFDRDVVAAGTKHVVKLESKPNENWEEERKVS